MLRPTKNTSGYTSNKPILNDVSEINSLLIKLSNKQSPQISIANFISKNENLLDFSKLHVTVLFLTYKNQNIPIKKILKWLGIDNEFNREKIFEKGVESEATYENGVSLKVEILHFENYSPQRILIPEKDIQVIVYDQEYLSQLPNYNLAIKLLEKSPSICFLIDISKENIFTIPQITNIYTKEYLISELEDSILTSLLSIDTEKLLETVRLLQFISYVKKISLLIEENFELKQMQFRGKSIIVNQKLQEVQNTKSELSTKDLNFTKSRITNDFKYITRSIEESFDNFDKNNSELQDLQEDILSFLGFVEIKRSKNLTLKIADGAIQDKLDKTNNILTDFLEKTNKDVNNHLAQLNLWLKNTYSVRNINIPNISISKLSTSLIRETLAVSNIFPEKVYEKQISFKNLGHLLMELRTPLFMLMPFMMVFAVFGALINSEDLGTIDESQLFYNNRPCVAITSLPVSRDNAFRKFINELNALRDPKNGVFDKEINNELVTEPQLAIKKMEVVQSYNNKIKVEETLDYHFDNKNQILYLFLRENADRSFVIEQLFDPNNKLLSIPSSNRRGFGIGGFIRALSSLHEYKYVILISLVSLIFWFVVSRKKSMDIELKTSKEREQSKLNSDLRQHIEKNIKQSLLKYNSKIIAELNTLETSIIKDMERNILNKIEASKKETIKKEKVMQKRLSGLKTEKNTLTSWRSDFNKLVKKTTQIETKLKRLKRY